MDADDMRAAHSDAVEERVGDMCCMLKASTSDGCNVLQADVPSEMEMLAAQSNETVEDSRGDRISCTASPPHCSTQQQLNGSRRFEEDSLTLHASILFSSLMLSAAMNGDADRLL
ncbi:hypothetical protein KP509_20G059500 [Ceratopteris richardii]|uniref:Uncharacterized protein n=1 Tax=Ceratopteris richardii TaxID=49495 RepID=A0A8T2SIT9_CERRI|nr:hypothetical protein KP509_20G059500 [Ceratopteris richardii]